MRQMEEEDLREQEELRSHIKGLQADVDMWQRLYEEWRKQSEKLEAMLDREKQAKRQIELELRILRSSMVGSTDAVPLKPRKHQHNAAVLRKDDEITQNSEMVEDMTCGKCSNDSRCQCVEDAFKMSDIATGIAENNQLKRPLSPQNLLDISKRMRRDESNEEPTEIDFTTRHPPSLPNTTSSSSMLTTTAAVDSCGFCQDGTPCICAEINHQNENERRSQLIANNSSGTKVNELSSTCTNNPGNCTQCQSIPASKTFCISLAQSRVPSNKTNNSTAISSSKTGPTLNCADAFSRLAQHPAFPQASTQLNAWVPQLATRSMPSMSASDANNLEGRTAFEIEAASVMNVLKLFDVRFGENRMKNENEQQSKEARDEQG